MNENKGSRESQRMRDLKEQIFTRLNQLENFANELSVKFYRLEEISKELSKKITYESARIDENFIIEDNKFKYDWH